MKVPLPIAASTRNIKVDAEETTGPGWCSQVKMKTILNTRRRATVALPHQ